MTSIAPIATSTTTESIATSANPTVTRTTSVTSSTTTPTKASSTSRATATISKTITTSTNHVETATTKATPALQTASATEAIAAPRTKLKTPAKSFPVTTQPNSTPTASATPGPSQTTGKTLMTSARRPASVITATAATQFLPGASSNHSSEQTTLQASPEHSVASATTLADFSTDIPSTPSAPKLSTTTPLLLSTRSCYQCGSPSSPCSLYELLAGQPTPCAPGLDYCASYVTQLGGSRGVVKKCITLETCFKKWYQESSDLTECVTFDPRDLSLDLECKYCCTGDNCNMGVKPHIASLYNPSKA
ncbi:hypothetical protein PoB_003107100 [Plakobranchus ocellatus]|uniref:Uncharacterized protein n=1 Tax=Plakobranchus ocellatus TaxID=259542 RepID=A0AAV4A8E9_9GAST|nr:hypothetical protein PoB_003107100 [Plakobranchus ocellatus]